VIWPLGFSQEMCADLGPAYVFLVPLGVDLLLKIPMLTRIPETLRTAPHFEAQD
jgi:hypothetical protein